MRIAANLDRTSRSGLYVCVRIHMNLVIEFNWPTGLEGEERPSCVDIESALDGLALDRPKERWCNSRNLEERGGVEAAILALDPPKTQ